jgi:hypothetical protein
VVSLGVTGNLSKRVGFDLHGLGARNDSGGPKIRTVVGHFRLSYRLSARLLPFISADLYRQDFTPLLDTRLSRRRFFGGLEIVLSKPSETATSVAPPATDAQTPADSDLRNANRNQTVPQNEAVQQDRQPSQQDRSPSRQEDR